MKTLHSFYRSQIAVGVMLIALSGCAGTSMPWWTSQPAAPIATPGDKPIPRVQDCVTIGTGTPSKYVCNAKTYTSHELRKLREAASKGS